MAMDLVRLRTDAAASAFGGHPLSERRRLVYGPARLLCVVDEEVLSQEFLGAVRIHGSFRKLRITHRDVLGSIMGTGVSRGKVGDVRLHVDEDHADVVVVPNLVEHFCGELRKVGKADVRVEPLGLKELRSMEPTLEESYHVEASSRLDAIASSAFRLSRSKVATLVKEGDVRVNWEEVRKGTRKLQPGDVFSIAGMGRARIVDIQPTGKGKQGITVERYL